MMFSSKKTALALLILTSKMAVAGMLLLLATTTSIAKSADTKPNEDPPKIGLNSLPASQQFSSFHAFGQNIIGKDVLQLYVQPFYTHNMGEHYLDLTPSFLYGLTDNSSILINVPFAVDYYSDHQHSSGIADLSIQTEYAFFSNDTSQATLVTALSLPTGSVRKNPATGLGTPSYFLGTVYNQTFVNWMWFTSPGILWASSSQGVHPGTQYLYQLGVGRNIHSVPDKYIFAGLVEIDGEYSEKDKLFGRNDPDSGGNIIYFTPSLWFSTQSLIVQIGISLPIIQRLNGVQNKNNYIVGLILGYTFS